MPATTWGTTSPSSRTPMVSSASPSSALPPGAPSDPLGNFCTTIMLPSKVFRFPGRNGTLTTRCSFSKDLREVLGHGVKELATMMESAGARCCIGWRKRTWKNRVLLAKSETITIKCWVHGIVGENSESSCFFPIFVYLKYTLVAPPLPKMGWLIFPSWNPSSVPGS